MIRFVSAFLLCAIPAAVAAQPSMVIVVRHAERDTAPPRDPVLTDAGVARARALYQSLSNAGIGSVVTTHLQRTQLTAKPITDSLKLTPIVVAASSPVAAHADAVAAAVRARPRGEVVLVVGHSNTVPAIVAALGGPKFPDLCDSQYSMLYVLQYPDGGGSPRFVQSNYGATDPAEPAGCPRTMTR